MPDVLRERLRQTEPFKGQEEEAMLVLLVASSSVRRELNEVCGEHGILASQYNILRILTGGPPEGYPRREIIARMIDRNPDVTRLTDALEEKGLVERHRSQEDRRVMLHQITDAGRELVRVITEDLEGVEERFVGAFSEGDMKQFARMCIGIVQQFE